MSKFPFKSPPSAIQLRAMKKAYAQPYYALYHAIGAGKTFTTINLASARYLKDKIKHCIVIANPSAIKDVWEVELEKHSPIDYDVFVFNSGDRSRFLKHQAAWGDDRLHWSVYGIEAFSQGNAIDVLEQYISDHKHEGIMMVIDEATGIKTPSAARTKKITKQGARCQYRLILTGTPITQGYQDLFAQMNFLSPDILGIKSYVLFRNTYCVMGGFENRQIIGYQRQQELMDRIAPYVDIVTKEEAMPDLPPKQMLPPIVVKPSPEQREAMETLKSEFMAEDNGDILTVTTTMERIMRYQQICGGFFPYDDTEKGGYAVKKISGKNPKLIALMKELELMYEQGEKCIIWARFVPEVTMIVDEIKSTFGEDTVVSFYGLTENRKESTRRFETDPRCMFIVSSQAVGAKGQTWVAATQVRYYSQTFSYEDRMQSEDRAHRRGQEKTVGYRDILVDVNAEKMVTVALSKKHDVATEFKDGIKNIDLGA